MATLPVAIDARKAKSGAAEAERAFQRTTDAARKTDQSVNKLDQGMARAGKTAGTVKKLFVSAFAGLSAFMVLRDITSTVADFGQEMSTLRAVTGANIEQMADFEDQARALGASTRFSATEAAEGMTFLARAGFEANEVLAAIPDTLNLAIAGALDLGEAADIASNVLSQFNMAAEETGRVGDVLVNTANSANTNVQQLAEALKLAGPVAGALGISLEETAASIGVLGDSGIQASLAGTNLRGVLAALLGPTTAAEQAIKGMGLSVEELDPSTTNLISIFKKFEQANLSAADAVEIFGRRNAAAALIFAGNTEKLEELTQSNKDAADTAKEAAQIMQNNLAGSFKSLRSTIEEAWLTVGDQGFTGGLKSMVDTARDAVRIILEMEAGAEGFGVAAKALAAAIRGVAAGLVAMLALKTALFFQGLVSGVTGLAGAMTALRTAMIAHPIFALATVVAAASAAVAIFVGETEGAEESIKRLSVTTGGLNDEIERFVEAQKNIEKGKLFGRQADEAQGLRDQVSVLEDVLVGLRGELERGGEEAWKNFFDLSAVGVTMEDFEANLDQLSGRIQEWARNAGEGAQIGIIPLADAIKLVENELDQMREKAVEAGIALDETAVQDDIQSRIDQAVAVKEARQALEDQIQAIKDERELLRASDEYREVIIARREAEKNMIGLTDEERKKYLDTIEEEIRKNQELVRQQEEREEAYEREQEMAAARAEGQMALDNYLVSLGRERELLAVSNDEKELMEALQHAANIATETGAELTKDHINAIYDEIKALQDARKAQEDEYEAKLAAAAAAREAQRAREAEARENERIANMWARPFVDALEDIITQTESVEDALKNLYKALSQMALQQFLLTPLQGQLAGAFGAEKGAIFDATNNIVPFQYGGIAQGPTLFSYAGGNKIGLMGEAGPESEAVVPLARTSSGRLGVEVAGGGGAGPTYKTVNMTVITEDADSFRKSKRQILNDARKGIG